MTVSGCSPQRRTNLLVFSLISVNHIDYPATCSLIFNNLLNIFPLDVRGMLSTNSTPPSRALYLASLCTIHSFTSASLSKGGDPFCEVPDSGGDLRMTYARGVSPVAGQSAGTPTMATSVICGWPRRTDSSSFGETWRPRTLKTSFGGVRLGIEE
jgi:hypothetical protein